MTYASKAALLFSIALAAGALVATPGCSDDGAFEDAGEKIDNAVDDAGDAIDDAADDAADAVEDSHK